MILQATPGIALPLAETGSESCGVAATFPAHKKQISDWKAPLEITCPIPLAQSRLIQSQKSQSRLPSTQTPPSPDCSLTSAEELVLHAVALHLLLAARLLPAHLQGRGAQGREHQAGGGVRDAQGLPGV